MMDLTLFAARLKKENAEVKYYPYRSARLNHFIVTLEMDDMDEWDKRDAKRFLESLVELSGERFLGNHVVFEINFNDGCSYAVKYSDYRIYIGVGVKEGYW